MKQMTAAQAAQQDNRTDGGRYAEKQGGEPDLHLEDDDEVFRCDGCGRDELACSKQPCDDVILDRISQPSPGEPVVTYNGYGDWTVASMHPNLDEPLVEHFDSGEEAEVGALIARQRLETHTGMPTTDRTPWGEADNVSYPAPGIRVVSTPGHGGIKLSKERNAAIPSALRDSSGWYEEDCEAHIVAMHHPEAFKHRARSGHGLDDIKADGIAGVKNWFPDQYEAATGQAVDVSESTVLRDRKAKADVQAYREAHATEFVTTGGDRKDAWVPAGHRVVEVEQRSTGTTRHLLVPNSFWSDNGTNRTDTPIVADPSRFTDVTDVVAEASRRYVDHVHGDRAPVHEVTPVFDHLTDAQAERARAELSKRWRYADGQVRTFAEGLAHDGVTGKAHAQFDGTGKTTYYVQLPGSYIRKVSKATWDALPDIPDTTSAESKARLELDRAEASKASNRQARIDAARQALAAANAAEKAKSDAMYADLSAMVAAKLTD